MKKLLLCAAVAVFGLTSVNAQEETTTGGFNQGDLYVSGTVGFSSTKQDEAKTNEFTFSPSVGYFINDNIALELGLSIGSAENVAEVKTTTLGADLSATYFFTPSDQFSFTVGAGFGYENQTVKVEGSDDAKVNAFAFGVAPGVNYFVSNNFALRASVGVLSYGSAKADFDGAEALNALNFNLDLSDINFGIVYKF